jgi:hypothetical protein
MIWIFCKVMQEYGTLPQVLSAESLFLDLCVEPETAQRLQQNKAQDIAHFYSLFKREPSRRRSKRFKRGTMDGTQMQSAVVVKFVALLTRMACVVSSADNNVDWTTVEKQVRLWLVGSSFLRADVTVGLALAALDIVDSCHDGEPTVNDVTITGLTPRRIYNMLQLTR